MSQNAANREVRHHRLWSGGGLLGRLPQQAEGWSTPGAAAGISQVQAAKAPTGVSGRRRSRHGGSGRQDRDAAEDRAGGGGGASAVRRFPPSGDVNRTAGTWFALFCIWDGRQSPALRDGPTIGVDAGVGMMAMGSDGTKVTNPKALGSGTMGLRRLDQAVARIGNIHGKGTQSNRRERLYARRGSLHARIVNVRNDITAGRRRRKPGRRARWWWRR